ncbi:monovalent cation/H(+) antiporter subunit G [Candidatus Bipolaricaulota bacterium]|nr:monovalent cation/H(+) antiporter subunit G [Candidatus Bipolaricaulota bacterium]
MNVFSLILIYLGLVLMLVGSFGIARMPDIYSRLQSSGVSDTVGVIVMLTGFLLRNGFRFSDSFLGLLIIFFFVTGPIVGHSIAKSAFLSKVEPSHSGERDEDE